MFFVLRKDKMISYMVSVCTVIILMVMAFSISKSQEVIEHMAKRVQNGVFIIEKVFTFR